MSCAIEAQKKPQRKSSPSTGSPYPMTTVVPKVTQGLVLPNVRICTSGLLPTPFQEHTWWLRSASILGSKPLSTTWTGSWMTRWLSLGAR